MMEHALTIQVISTCVGGLELDGGVTRVHLTLSGEGLVNDSVMRASLPPAAVRRRAVHNVV